MPEERKLLCFLLLLLTDADLEVQHFSVLEGLVIVPGDGIRKVLVDISLLGKNGHQRKIVVAGRAIGPEPLHIWNSHNSNQFSRSRLDGTAACHLREEAYSHRNAKTGAILVARRAGTTIATSATAASARATHIKVTGSPALTP